jgi:prevent-host-death family protein
MQATIVDLRYKTKEVLSAVERREPVTITYRGKDRFQITPIENKKSRKSCRDFDFIGSDKGTENIEDVMKKLRGGRYADL